MFISRQIYYRECELEWSVISFSYETKPKLSVNSFSLQVCSLLGDRREGVFLTMLCFPPLQTTTLLTEHHTDVLYSKSEHMVFILLLAVLISEQESNYPSDFFDRFCVFILKWYNRNYMKSWEQICTHPSYRKVEVCKNKIGASFRGFYICA